MKLSVLDRHADDADHAADLQQLEIDIAIKSAKNKLTEKPEYNKNGLRICLDCEELIPIERIRLVNAVRCIYCQSELEKEVKLYSRKHHV